MFDSTSDARLEIAHVLFVDIVGWSKLLINEQSDLLRRLNDVVRSSAQVRAAEAAGKLIRLPTGDGMALAFFTTPDAPVRCAVEIGKALKDHPDLPLRMGIHSGPVDEVVDVNERANIAGAGITIAQRVMDCGDAGHILLSKRAADDLAHYSQWRPLLHDLGEFEVKHGLRVGLVNLHDEQVGNPVLPSKLQPAVATGVVRRSNGRNRAILLGSALVLTALIVVAVWKFLPRTSPPSPTDSAAMSTSFGKRLAVLPFKPLVAETSDQVLELGMADSLITKLSNSREIIVTSLPAVRKYSGLEQDPVAAGRQLQVDSVLEGNVQQSGNQIRVSVRLINVRDGSSAWAQTFDEKFTDVFALQDTISSKVAEALALQLSSEDRQRLIRRYTDDVDAYQLYISGRYYWSRLTPADVKRSIEYFQQAIDKDPNYALAYFGLAEAHRSLAINADIASKDCLPQAIAAAKKALDIDPSVSEPHTSLSFSLVWYEWDWSNGEKQAQRAVDLNPNSAHAHFAMAHLLSNMAKHDQAIAEIARARQLDPVFPLYGALEGMILIHAGRDTEAAVKLQKWLEKEPNFWVTHLMLGKVQAQQGKTAEAIAELEKAAELSHGNSEAIGSIGYVAGMSGDKDRANAVLEQLKALSTQRYIPPYNVALVYAGLGQDESALAELNRACDERDVRVTLLKVDPRWNSLRSDPNFAAILKRIGLD
ncbi:MAG TPA: tetratricopeptide repeat protein [Chthoniobacterales bacterium]|nr:tetratricopeptide repeat protein [Chthoniobacterales bacterium]